MDYHTIVVSVDVKKMFKWNSSIDFAECVKQHAECLSSDRMNTWNKFFIDNEGNNTTKYFVKSTISRFISVLESDLTDSNDLKVSSVYEDDESGEYFEVRVEYDNEELIVKRLTDAVYEFLQTKEEIIITKDLLKTQIAVYKLSV